MYLLINSLILNFDASSPWGIYFQDSATPQMEVELQENILYYLVIILFAAGWIFISTLKKKVFSINSLILNFVAKLFKHFTFTNILVGILTILVVSLFKWLDISQYIINYMLNALPAEYTLLAEYSILGLIGLFFRLLFKGIIGDFFNVPLNIDTLAMNNNPLSESGSKPVSLGGSTKESGGIKELDSGETKDSSSADSKNSSDDRLKKSDKGKAPENPAQVSKQAKSWEEWNARKGNNSSYSANKLSSRLLKEQKQLADLLNLLSLEASNSESPESFNETQKEFDKAQEKLAQITFATMDKDLIAASTSTNAEDWSKDNLHKRSNSAAEGENSNKKSKEE